MLIDRRQLLAASAAGFASLSLGNSAAQARDLPTANPKSQGFDAERLTRIGRAMQRRIDNAEAPGFLTAIMRHGKIVHFDVRGYRNIETKTPLTRDTVFRIMSMTKPIVSVAAMILVEENRLRLTDPVAKYIPSFAQQQVYVSGEGDNIVTAPAKRRIQIRNLLMHTSGYTYGVFSSTPMDKLHFARKVYVPFYKTLAEFADAAAAMPLMFEPGTNWQYGISTDILGRVIEVVTGQRLGEFISERILSPLGMTQTGFTLTGDQEKRLITCYKPGPGGKGLAPTSDMFPGEYRDPTHPQSGGGGLVSTADDYLRFATMLLNGGELDGTRIIGPETVKIMRTNQLSEALTAQRDSGFGFGFGVDLRTGARGQYAGEGTFHWSGANRTHFWVDPANKIVGLSMTQMDPFDQNFEEDMRALTYQAFIG
ncbi:MAG: beta-lactamase family protein [Rhodospirillaceae bacterium]|nr:beta-lactamase family protein [Rhodospirillaceae bacterium]